VNREANALARHRDRPRSLPPIIVRMDRDMSRDFALPAKSVRQPATVQP
jgi:hypothetical protein